MRFSSRKIGIEPERIVRAEINNQLLTYKDFGMLLSFFGKQLLILWSGEQRFAHRKRKEFAESSICLKLGIEIQLQKDYSNKSKFLNKD